MLGQPSFQSRYVASSNQLLDPRSTQPEKVSSANVLLGQHPIVQISVIVYGMNIINNFVKSWLE